MFASPVGAGGVLNSWTNELGRWPIAETVALLRASVPMPVVLFENEILASTRAADRSAKPQFPAEGTPLISERQERREATRVKLR
jgi:hypothetical protein